MPEIGHQRVISFLCNLYGYIETARWDYVNVLKAPADFSYLSKLKDYIDNVHYGIHDVRVRER